MDAIKHLYARAGFGILLEDYPQLNNLELQRSIDKLFKEALSAPALEQISIAEYLKKDWKNLSPDQRKELREKGKEECNKLSNAWFSRMVSGKDVLLERVCLFWHGHFACRIENPHHLISYMNVLRKHGLGDFRSLLLAIAKSPAMIKYLNNQQNRKESPNENFARELLELFTLGRGKYTEQDIKEAARAFTGWATDKTGSFVFRQKWHDEGEKEFMGKRGNFGGEDIIAIILDNPDCADYIARKIYAYFVHEEIDEERMRELGERFYRSGLDIAAFLRHIFESDWFYTQTNRGAKIKAPIELLVGICHTLNVQFEKKDTLKKLQRTLGQQLFNPPNVAGWPSGKAWIDNSTLMLRLTMLNALSLQNKKQFKNKFKASSNLNPLIRALNKNKDIYPQLADLLFNCPPPDKNIFSFFIDKSSPESHISSLCIKMMCTPEYQMC